jgi:hypothetical protein
MLAILVLLVLVAVLALAGSALTARTGWLLLPVAAIGVVVVLVGVTVGLRGSGGSSDEGGPPRADVPSSSTVVPRVEERVRPADVRIDARRDEPFARGLQAVDELGDGEVRLVELRADVGLVTGLARQCAGDLRSCEPAVPVQTDVGGRARFLFQFHACEGCILDIEVGREPIVVPLVFGARGPRPGRVSVVGAVRDGRTVSVDATGFAAGATGVVTQCGPPGPVDPRACGAPAARVPIRFGPSGTAHVDYPVHVGRVGAAAQECKRGRSCAIAVLVDGTVGADALAVVSFAGSDGAAYEGGRLLFGLALAAVLLAAAALLTRRTDWAAVGLPSQLEP